MLEVLPRELARAGLVPTMWKTGHSLIKQKMKESKAPLAGEMSGHMFFGGDWYGFDDALFAAGPVAALRGGGGGTPVAAARRSSGHSRHPGAPCRLRRRPKFEIVRRAAKHFAGKYPVSTLDGVRITFAQGWGLLRASEYAAGAGAPLEAATDAALASYRTEVESWLAAQSPGA